MRSVAVFGVLFFRLWALEVLSGPQYLHAAVNNQLRSIPLEAPRGPVLDREGRTIVDNRAATAVQLWTADLPQKWSARLNELRRLSKIINVPVREMVGELKKRGGDPATPVTVQESVHQEQALYLQEREREFPGVDLAPTYLRNYPYESLAAQVLGTVGLISPSQYSHLRGKGYLLSDKVGQGGIEARYDAYLRGKDGLAQLRVDALGRPRSGLITEQSAQPGEAVRLTLDMKLQRAAEQGIRAGIAAAHASNCVGCWAADGGAIVALDPRNGSILALASNPTFQPSVFGSHNPKKLAPLLNPTVARKDNYPGVDRAIAGVYPAGSTFKPVTALAALEERLVTPTEPIACTGAYHVYDKQGNVIPGGTFKNWDPFVSQQMTMSTALEASCDTYFYELGNRFYKLPAARRHPFQEWAARYGSRPSRRATRAAADAGVAQSDVHAEDRPGAVAGRPPLEAWRFDPACDRSEGPAGDAAADGALLCADRKRRPAGAAAHRRRCRGGQQQAGAGPRPAQLRPAAGADRQARPALPRRRAPGPAASDARPQRDLDGRLRHLPGSDRRQDRDGREERDHPRLHRETRSVVVVRVCAGRRADDHGLRPDRERRSRRHRRGACGTQGLRGVFQDASNPGRGADEE